MLADTGVAKGESSALLGAAPGIAIVMPLLRVPAGNASDSLVIGVTARDAVDWDGRGGASAKLGNGSILPCDDTSDLVRWRPPILDMILDNVPDRSKGSRVLRFGVGALR